MRHLTILSLELALLLSSRIRYGYGYVVSSQSSNQAAVFFFWQSIKVHHSPISSFRHASTASVCSSHGCCDFDFAILLPFLFFRAPQADEEMAAKKSSGGGGGIKGFLTRAGSSFYAGGLYAREKGAWLAQKAGRIGFIIATTSIVTLMPLIFEITREGQVCSHAVCLQRLGSVLFPPARFLLIIPCRLCS